jgi:hypothetical protein
MDSMATMGERCEAITWGNGKLRYNGGNALRLDEFSYRFVCMGWSAWWVCLMADWTVSMFFYSSTIMSTATPVCRMRRRVRRYRAVLGARVDTPKRVPRTPRHFPHGLGLL